MDLTIASVYPSCHVLNAEKNYPQKAKMTIFLQYLLVHGTNILQNFYRILMHPLYDKHTRK